MDALRKVNKPYVVNSEKIVKKYQNILKKMNGKTEKNNSNTREIQKSDTLEQITCNAIDKVFGADNIRIVNEADMKLSMSNAEIHLTDYVDAISPTTLIINTDESDNDSDDDCMIIEVIEAEKTDDSNSASSSASGSDNGRADQFLSNLLKTIKTEKVDTEDVEVEKDIVQPIAVNAAQPDVTAMFDDDLEISTTNIKVDLGMNNIYFCFDNGVYSIGEFYPKRGGNSHELIAGGRYIELDIAVVHELLKKLHTVDEDMERMRKKQIIKKKYDLGAGWYLCLSHPWQCVHVRRWEAVNGGDYPAKATTEGFAFKFFEYRRFQEVAMQMQDFVPALREYIPCYERHNNDFSDIFCSYCNPYALYVKTK